MVLPTYLERQISGIKDEKTLYSTLPKLSAQLYSFGVDVGNAGNQILSGIAQSKFNELRGIKQDEQNRQLTEAYGNIYKEGVSAEDFQNVAKQLTGMDPEVASKIAPSLYESKIKSQAGILTSEGSDYFYQSYELDKFGKATPKSKFQYVKTDKGYALDDLSTEGIENLPLGFDAAKQLQTELDWKNKLESQLKKQLQVQAAGYDIAIQKQKNANMEWAKKQLYFDRNTKEPVFLKYDENERPVFYKKGKENISTQYDFIGGKTPFTREAEIPVTNLGDIEQVGQVGPNGQITATTVDQNAQNVGRYLGGIGKYVVDKGIGAKEDIIQKDTYGNPTGYYDREAVKKVVEENPDDVQLQQLWQNMLQLEAISMGTIESYSGLNNQPTGKTKPKWNP